MSEKNDDFFVHVISNTNDKFYKNTLTDFTNYLPNIHALKDRKWLCAITGFGLNLNINHLKLKPSVVGVYYLPDGLVDLMVIKKYVLNNAAYQLKFADVEYFAKTLGFTFMRYFKNLSQSTNLARYLSIRVVKSEDKLTHKFALENKGKKTRFFCFTKN